MHMQHTALEMVRESQAAALRAQMAWPEMFKDPLRWYQSVCQESIDGARKAFDAVNETSEAVTQSVSRLQTSTQEAGNKIERALSSAASRMKDAA
jgi:predicted  nucleic acid-binding Zn-ribbon protein